MRKIAFLLALLPGLALAQVSAQVRIDLPVVLPALVVVSPGIQVVQDFDREVFFVDGYYWCRHDGGWVRSRNHRGGWVVVPAHHVPPGLVRLPPGRYKHWKPEKVKYEKVKYDDRDHDHGHGNGNGNGNGNGHGKHKH